MDLGTNNLITSFCHVNNSIPLLSFPASNPTDKFPTWNAFSMQDLIGDQLLNNQHGIEKSKNYFHLMGEAIFNQAGTSFQSGLP